MKDTDKDKQRIDELWAELYDQSPSPTTEAEITAGWTEFDFDDLSEDKKPFREGDLIKHEGKDARVKECYGKNAKGRFEYYIEYCIPVNGGCYVNEDDICFPCGSNPSRDTPPPVADICDHEGAYENVISASLSFWVCPKCKKEIDKPVKRLTQDEIDDLFG